MVYNAAVRLFRQAFVKTAVARLHMKDGDVQALCADGRKAAVGVAQNQQRVRLFLHHQGIAFGNDVANGLAKVGAHGIQVIIRRAQAKVFKKNLVQRVIVVLARVHQKLVKVYVALFNHGRKADNLRPCAHNGHQFQLAHGCPFIAKKCILSEYKK